MAEDVSVIVPVYNGELTIEECIKSLLNLDYPKERYEVIIVDNNSTDNTVGIVKQYPVKLLHEHKQGPYAARNFGIENAKGKIVAFTDADCVVDKEWIKQLVKNFTDPTIAGVGGEILAYNPKTLVERYSDKNGILSQRSFFDTKFCGIKMPFMATANAAYQKKIVHEIGLFDDSFFTGGDVDLAWRITAKGYKIVYEPKALVFHKHRTTSYGLFKQFFGYGDEHAKLFKIHSGLFTERYVIDILAGLSIPYNLMVRLPWRILTAYQYGGEERKLYIATPILNAIQMLGLKLGWLWGSIKYGVIFL